MNEENQNITRTSAVSWLFHQMGDRKGAFVMSVITALISAIAGLLPYYFVSRILVLLVDGEKNMEQYVLLGVYMGICFLVKVVFHSISTAMSHKNTFRILCNVRKMCADKLGRMQLGEVLRYKPGDLKGTLMEKIDEMETTLAHIIPEFTTNLIAPVFLLIYVFSINWKMGLATIITIPVGFACYCGMMIGYEENYWRTLRAGKALNDISVEYISGIEVIKVFGKADASYDKFVAAAEENANSFIDWMRKCNIYFAFAMQLMPATMLAVLPIGCIMYMHGNLGLSQLFTIIALSIALIDPLITVMSYSDDIARIGAITNEIRRITDAEDMDRPAGLLEKPEGLGLELRNVHFGYQEKEVIHGINLAVEEGSFVALVGPSGSGKSTIAKLIASFWDPDQGTITLGGVDLRKLPLDYCSRAFAYVSQDTYLFNQTIRENIAMGKMDGKATEEEVIDVAKKSGCHEFIMSLEKGYDTMVGSAGGHLSGGERQRISIARAMLKDAPIIILDEATAYTDPENEARIQRSVAKLVEGKTLIVIAHRLSTIKDADRIYVISEGNVVEQGTHEELTAGSVEGDGLYLEMWQAHLSGKDRDEEGKEE